MSLDSRDIDQPKPGGISLDMNTISDPDLSRRGQDACRGYKTVGMDLAGKVKEIYRRGKIVLDMITFKHPLSSQLHDLAKKRTFLTNAIKDLDQQIFLIHDDITTITAIEKEDNIKDDYIEQIVIAAEDATDFVTEIVERMESMF